MAVKSYQPDRIRNIALLSHSGVGKTTLIEALLFSKGVTQRMGSIEEGNTIGDYREIEIERKSSVNLSVIHLDHNDNKINIIDTPGYADFVGEVYSALRVVEGTVLLVSAQSGIEVGTRQSWGYKGDSPTIVFINKMDRDNADFDKVIEELRDTFSDSIVPFALPIGSGETFKGVVDILSGRAFEYKPGDKGIGVEIDIPADITGKVESMRTELVERAAESDEALMKKYFDTGELTSDEIAKGLASSVASGALHPTFLGCASKNMGTDILLNAITNLIPSPTQIGATKGSISIDGELDIERKANPDESFSAIVFKLISEPHVGELTFFRVYSGKMTTGNDVQNTTQSSGERVGLLFAANGRNRIEIPEMFAGDIGVTVKLRSTKTGDTLCDKKAQLVYPGIDFPHPNVSEAVVSKKKGDEDKVAQGLSKLHDEDPTFFYSVDSELHQTLVYGQGELQLELMVKNLKSRFNVDVELKKPRIPYRETITKNGSFRYRHKKQSGGAGEFAEVEMQVEPNERGEGFEYEWKIFGGAIDKTYQSSIEKGITQSMKEGVIAGYPVIDVKASVIDGKQHPVDSKDVAFQKCGREVFRQAFMLAGPIMLEPIDTIEVFVPDDFTGDVMGDISSRRGRIQGMEPAGRNLQKIVAHVPDGELYKYSTVLRSMTQGRAWFKKEFAYYETMPREFAEKVIAESKPGGEE